MVTFFPTTRCSVFLVFPHQTFGCFCLAGGALFANNSSSDTKRETCTLGDTFKKWSHPGVAIPHQTNRKGVNRRFEGKMATLVAFGGCKG